jgi:hypothetical protein
MAVAIRSIRGGAAPLPSTWRGRVSRRLVVPIVGASLLFGMVASTAISHGAELAQGIQAGREMAAGTGAWLSTAAAQAFTMQCAHARVR